jgi:DHA1 family bicyclomycin/chloramphenicol resistance-like MFS transporter
VLLGALTTFGPLSMDLYLPGLPALGDDLSASASAAQLTITACMAGLALGQLLAGPISDALGRRRPMIAGVLLFATASGLCAFAPSIWTLLGLRLVQGMAGAAGISIARAMVRDITSGGAATARVFAMLMLVTGIAPLLAPLLGGLLLHVTDWRGVFAVLAGIGALLLLAAVLRLPETLPPSARRVGGTSASLGAMGVLLRDRAFVAYALCVGLAFATLTIYLAGSSYLLEDVHGLTPALFGLVFAVNAAGMILNAQLSARLVQRLGPSTLLGFGLATGAVAAVVFLIATLAGAGLVILLPCLFVLVGSRGMVGPNAQALALTEHPKSAGTASGLMGVCQFGIAALAAPLAGLGGATATKPMAFALAASALAAIGVLALSVRAEARTPASMS